MWPFIRNNRDGEPLIGDPEELIVRWENKHLEIKDAQGLPLTLDAQVHVPKKIKVNSIMWLAADTDCCETALEQWYGTGSGMSDYSDETELMTVVQYDETPDIRNRVARRTVGLMRYKGTLPDRA